MKRRIPQVKLVVVFFLFTIFLSITGYFVSWGNQQVEAFQNLLKQESEKSTLILSDEVKKYIFGLQGAKGALVADDLRMDRDVFARYAQSRDNFSNFRGAFGFGFIRFINSKDLAEYEKRMARSYPGFKVHPKRDSDSHMVVEFFEPLGLNKLAIGLDIAYESNRREGALYAARTGQAALTKRITLIRSADKEPGFLYFMPIYRDPTLPATESERLRELVGWAYTAIEASVLFSDIVAKFPPGLSLRIDFGDGSEPLILGDISRKSRYLPNALTQNFAIGGQNWQLEFRADATAAEKTLLQILLIYIAFFIAFVFAARALLRIANVRDTVLDEQASWLNAILASAAHSVIATNSEGIITTFNVAAERMLGFDAKELVDLKSPSVFHDLDEIQAYANQLSAELGEPVKPGFGTFVAKAKLGEVDVKEWTYISKAGLRIPVRLYVTAIRNKQKEVIGFLGIAEDLTKQNLMRKTIEEQQVRMLQESKMAVLGEMAGGIAHEINTPLAIITGNAELLRAQIESDPDHATSVQNADKIIETSQRIARLTRGLIQFSRNSEMEAPQSFLISEVVTMTMELCRNKLVQGEIQVRKDIVQELKVLGRDVEISQILINLIDNSVDAVEQLPERWIELKAEATPGRIQLSVTDSGPGIAPSIADKIMNPFFTTKEVGKGTGLGLSISKGLAEQNGGRLYLDKNSPHTRFVLELPVG